MGPPVCKQRGPLLLVAALLAVSLALPLAAAGAAASSYLPHAFTSKEEQGSLVSALEDAVLDDATVPRLQTSVIPEHLLKVASAAGDAVRGASRNLLAATAAQYAEWQQKGRYAIIANPKMPNRRSSTGQVAIHAVLLPETYKILLAGRNLPRSGPKSIPEPGIGGNVSTVYDVKTGTYVVTPNYETVFCTAHTVMSDGVVVLAGGDMGEPEYPWMKEGRYAVRLFDRFKNTYQTLSIGLSEPRWYPTQLNLPDDRVIIVSGFSDDPRKGAKLAYPVPSIDVYDHRNKQIVARLSKEALGTNFFTNIIKGYQLYPSVYLIPWTDPKAPGDYFLYFFTCHFGQVVRFTTRNQFVPVPNWKHPGLPVPNMCSQFSAMGSSVMLPFRKSKGYQFEVALFGGGTMGKGLDCAGICNAPAAAHVFRLKLPTAADAFANKNWPKTYQYTGNTPYELMPFPRCFADAVLLPNGKVVILNGAQRGVPGGLIAGGGMAKDAAFTAVYYDPDAAAGKRMKVLATSTIKRYYHSNALLLPSGDVWVAGSEQTDCINDCRTKLAPPGQEYRAELLQLPYAFVPRPEITYINMRTVKYGGRITIVYKHSRPVGTASIVPPGANTHSLNMMQRVVFLDIVDRGPQKTGEQKVTVQMPDFGARVAMPGYYMLWIMDGDAPCKEARWIKLVV